ncbi:MAG: hypothetical protein KY476_08005 [Planctomycetes bacterium]|nr:hypothetical protein [Planctomycetota bacterium]
MRTMAVMVARVALAAWVGAAGLFVATSIREVRPRQAGFEFEFDSRTRDRLVVLRFPMYYACGFALVGVGAAAGVAARRHPALGRRRGSVACGLALAALATMLVDYFFVYRPLEAMILPAGGAKPASFVALHEASKWINAFDVSLCLAAALLFAWPGRTRHERESAAAPPQ